MKVLFLNPPFGSWVYWGNHKAINVAHAQMAACLREWMPEADIKALDCRALDMDEGQMLQGIRDFAPDRYHLYGRCLSDDRDDDHYSEIPAGGARD